jgi:hypothetical protein
MTDSEPVSFRALSDAEIAAHAMAALGKCAALDLPNDPCPAILVGVLEAALQRWRQEHAHLCEEANYARERMIDVTRVLNCVLNGERVDL